MMRVKVVLFTLSLVLLNNLSEASDEMKKAEEEGRMFGKNKTAECLDASRNTSFDDLVPKDANMADLDPKTLEKSALQKDFSDLNIDFLKNRDLNADKHFSEEESFLTGADDLAKNLQVPVDIKADDASVPERHVKCQEVGDPFFLNFTRELQVNVKHTPKVEKDIKGCLGHEVIYRGDVKNGKPKPNVKPKPVTERTDFKKYSFDKHWDTNLFGNGTYKFVEKFTHKDGIESCDHFNLSKITVQEEKWEELGDEWIVKDQDNLLLSQSPDCMFVSSIQMEGNAEKIIEGKKISRPNWKESVSFKCYHPQIGNCGGIKQGTAILIERKCIKNTPHGCALWDLTFKIGKRNAASEAFDGSVFYYEHPKDETAPSKSFFSKVVSKLMAFDEMRKDLENSQEDARTASIFRGESCKCHKNVADKLFYDCCVHLEGIAITMNLTQCTAEEIALSEKRNNGLCHYVGHYAEKLLGLYKSSDAHVYCCFPSKFARVLQEEARKQLGKDWGTSEEPKCGGLTVDEITRLDFEKIDFREIYEDISKKIPTNLQERLKDFQDKVREKEYQQNLKKRMEEEAKHAQTVTDNNH